MNHKILALNALLAVAACLSTACQHSHNHENEAEAEEHHHEHDEIVFSPEQAKAAGLEIEKIKAAPFAEVIKTSGQILPAAGAERTIAATASGIVSYAGKPLTDGATVSAGQALYTISSKGIEDGNDRINAARVALSAAEKEYNRAKGLVKDRIITQKEFNEIEAKYEAARAELATIGGKAASGGVAVTTPISGFLVSELAKPGDYVTVGQPIAKVSQNKRLQLRVDISDRYAEKIPGISSANFIVPSSPEKNYSLAELNGRVVSAGKSSTDNSFYIPVVFEFDNSAGLVAGSIVEVYALCNTAEEAISVPVSALTEEQGLFFVYIREDNHAYRKQEVKLGMSDGSRVAILSGVNAGDDVVVKAANHLKLAANTGQIPEGHGHSH